MSNLTFSLTGKIAIVTGGRRGIGKAIALAFAKAGAAVVVCDQALEDGELKAVADQIQKLGRRSLAIQTDVTQKTEVDNLAQRVMDEFGHIDILVNNAAITIRAPLLELDEDSWDKVMNTNLKGCYLCSQAVGKRMVEQKKGNIINVASGLAFTAWARYGAYGISKAGVVMLTRVLARELGSYGIRVNTLVPSLTKTELTRATFSNPEVIKQEKALIPLGRIADPDDYTGAAVFLASDASSYVSGHTVSVDGGRYA